ncbi:MAG: hypothetical protein JWO97_4313, partial [Acidobacteria bacterium]|nr:hypothetical protein [Acidobacteriota bacterium]
MKRINRMTFAILLMCSPLMAGTRTWT